MRVAISLAVLLAVLTSGCGSSSSYADSTRSAVNHLSSTIRTYNQTKPSDLRSTAAACSAALLKLQGDRNQIVKASPPDQYRALARALRSAYLAAARGFQDCGRAARTLDYPLMMQANSELAAANVWINRARQLDRS